VTSSVDQNIVLVGGGVAAVRTAQALRDLGHVGPLTLVSEETEEPYDRPPLSKDMLAGDQLGAPTQLFAPDASEKLGVDLLLGRRAARVDTGSKQLLIEAHDPILYEALVVATGTRARTLPPLSGLSGVHHLRTAQDAKAIHAALIGRSRLTIVGGGFIGLELASVASQHGCEVTIIEVASTPLLGVLGEALAAWLQDWHTRRGVTFRCGVTVEDASLESDLVKLVLDDGSTLIADAVVVGVGVHRELEWLSASGLETHAGLVCDATGRTSTPGVFGAGDVVCVHEHAQCRPSQHWTAAVESGQRTARAVLGLAPVPVVAEEYFWSDQADLRLMSVGHRTPGARMEIVSGELAHDKFVAQWTDEEGRVVAVVGVNSAKDFLRGRMALLRGLESLTAR
jgi:3-phenylpropionate/trans-cinnamate dioxygenase ferredoxin reductase subunit